MRESLLVITAKQMVSDSEALKTLERAGWSILANPPKERQFLSSAELASACAGARAVILGDDIADKIFFREVAPPLELVVKWGVGTDGIDVAAAANCGVTVRHTPGIFGAEVSDLAIGYIITLARNILAVDKCVRQGQWHQPTGHSLQNKKLGIIGLGSIGQELARRAEGFGMEISYFDPYLDSSGVPSSWRRGAMESLFEQSDFIVLTCPSTAETEGLVDANLLALMKPSAFLVNVGRGSLVIEDDLIEALENGIIAGAALDVYKSEPPGADSPLLRLDKLLLGAHNGSNTWEGVARANQMVSTIVNEWIGKA